MATLALKVVLAPALVVASSLVSRRFGVRIGGVVAGLPAIAGPILLVLALDHGRAFAANAADGTLLGVVALFAFVVAYVLAASRFAWPVAVAAGWATFFAVVFALRSVHVGAVGALCAAAVAGGATLLILRPAAAEPVDAPHPPHDLLLRSACAVVPVVAITAAASTLGSHLSGLLASFPVITPVLAAFTHAQRGAAEATRLLHGMTAGFFGYALFCFVVGIALTQHSTAETFALATAVALVVQAATLAVAAS